jgi:hypothetical protein
MSPVLDRYYEDHHNHAELVVSEPFLCCVILTISSRYHTSSAPGGQSKGTLIHQKFWGHCQRILLNIILGRERGPPTKARSLGSIIAVLLLTDWQPLGLHEPPDFETGDPRDMPDNGSLDEEYPSQNRWLYNIAQSSDQFNRMSWMLIGCAISLASELGVFDRESNTASCENGTIEDTDRHQQQQQKVASLLYVYHDLLSSRLGRQSLMTESMISKAKFLGRSFGNASVYGYDWTSFMMAWTELTILVRSVSDVLFTSRHAARCFRQSGCHSSIIQPYNALLAAWRTKYMQIPRKWNFLYISQ